MNLVIFILSVVKTSPEELGGYQGNLNFKFRSRSSINEHSDYNHEKSTRDRSKDLEYIHSIFPEEKGPYYIYPAGVSAISYVKKRIPYLEPGITPRKGIRYPTDFIHNPFDHNHGYQPSVPHNPFDHNHGYPHENPDQDVNIKKNPGSFVGGREDGDNPKNKELKTLYDKFVEPPNSKMPLLGQDEELNQDNNFEHENERKRTLEEVDFANNKQLRPLNKGFKPSKDLPPVYILPVPTTEFPPSGHDPLHPYGYSPVGHDSKHPYGFLPEKPESSHSSDAPPFGHDPLHPHGYPPIDPESRHSHDLPLKDLKPSEPLHFLESTFTPDILSRGLKFKPFYPYGYPPSHVNHGNIDNPFAYDHRNPPNTRPKPFDQDMDNSFVVFPYFFERMGSKPSGISQDNTQDVGGKPQKIDFKRPIPFGFVPQNRVKINFEVTKSKK